MKYIYDIVLNFNDEFIEFFEWNDLDKIDFIKKIPVFKVNDELIHIFKYNDIKVDSSILNDLKNNTEVYTEFGIDILSNIVLLVSSNSSIAVEFNDNGKIIYKSDLLPSESLEIINCTKRLRSSSIKYKIINYRIRKTITRNEIKLLSIVKNELKIIKEENNIEKMQYLYYEIFNKPTRDKYLYEKIYKYAINNPKEFNDILRGCILVENN